jgi:hypothetical protein
VAGTQDVRRAIADSLTSMELIAVTGLDRYIGYWKPYATSHDVLDGDLRQQANFGGKKAYFFLRDEDRFRGTLAPERRASDRPIAIACFRLFTLRPERPLRSEPRFRSCIARLTLLCAFLP